MNNNKARNNAEANHSRGPQHAEHKPAAPRSQKRGGRGRSNEGRGCHGRGNDGRVALSRQSRNPRPVPEYKEEHNFDGTRRSGSTAQNIVQFCESLSRSINNASGIVRMVSNNSELWNQAFDAAAEATDMTRFISVLLKVFVNLPDQTRLSVSPERILPLLLKLLRLASDIGSLRLFLDVSSKLYRESCLSKMRSKKDVLAQVDDLLREIDSTTMRLLSFSPSTRDVIQLMGDIGTFMGKLQAIFAAIKVSGDECQADSQSLNLPVYMGWSSSPTLQWLLDARWLKHTPLQEQYESVEQYADTMKSLWTTLSFFWGAAAVSPRCHHCDNNQVCQVPLLFNSRNTYCTMKIHGAQGKLTCGKPALYGCFRFEHDAICFSCFGKKQKLIIGPPAQRNSSTDIYDAVIQMLSFRNDSTVLNLRNTLSRKPPETAINWPTTYRLQPTSLVALVSLAVSNASLKPDQHIFFGEIISLHSDDREEYARRSRGELSVRLLTKQDCIFLANNTPNFSKGSNVAVIDLRVFVPEVISVLATLCSPLFEQSLHRLSYGSKLLGILDVASTGDHIAFAAPLEMQVRFAVFHSDIQCIKRFTEADKQLLVQRICSIPNIQSMDSTQREALCNALKSSVHCTQGPPGTGKSYTGVALVLALMQVRELVRKDGGNTGPIIMLSYKNHALDEFLMDVLKSNGDLKGRRNSLIRLGNPENFALKSFTERRSAAESEAQKNLETALSVVKACLGKARELYLGGSAVASSTLAKLIELCHKHQDISIADITADVAYQFLVLILYGLEEKVIQQNIVPLLSSASHWNKTCNELYQLWMDGFTPPPRCAKRTDDMGQRVQCPMCAKPKGIYCAAHCCQVEDCSEERLDQGFYCGHHKCSAEHCQDAKMMPSRYCAIHSCKYCLDKCTRPGLATCFDHTCRVDQCTRSQLFPLQVCLEHKCMLCPSVVADSAVHQEVQRGFCYEHKCDQEFCQLSKAYNITKSEMTRYCEYHTCFKCVEVGSNLNGETMTLRYTCADHVLCEYINEHGDECCNLVIEKDEFYCMEHAALLNNDDVICHGVTGKGKKCKSKKPPHVPFQHPWYCDPHKNQRPNNRAEPVSRSQRAGTVSLVNSHKHLTSSLSSPFKCCYQGCSVVTCNGGSWMCPFHTQFQLWERKNSASKSMDSDGKESITVNILVNQDVKSMAEQMSAVEDELDYGFASDEDDVAVPSTDKQVSNNLDEMDANSMEVKLTAGDEGGDEADYERNRERHELYESESDSDMEPDGAEECTMGDCKALPGDVFKQLFDSACNWSWEMSKEHRVSKVDSFLVLLADLLEYLIQRADAYVDVLRKERAEASSAVLKQATLIGGTVVGAAKRLIALRAAEPFAVIVEEACEVMEPTLIAVLAVDSVQKMELIGDHRQLPAFINHYWYNFEITVPKIKKSLFERLINCGEKSVGAESICTVLDVQRRMRSNISDITRQHYQDKVVIQDHEKTASQRIGDRLVKDEKQIFNVCLKSWSHRGMHVPGIFSNLYFWNLKNNGESRPIAGLSACNETEALAVASLTKYLQFCGVPDSSITIITPYQGQRRLLIRILRKVGCMQKPEYSATSRPTETPKLIVSTVDRYQGDENDIVILSLVRTKAGNRFVSLVNRFIVATSRARIGFYVVGSVSAVSHEAKDVNRQDLKHWDSFLQMMTNGDGVNSYVGESLPICCPTHINTFGSVPSTTVASIKFPCTPQEWASFCRVPCTTKLACGHECDLPCHMYGPAEHNKKCMVMMPRDCTVHNQLVPCHELTTTKNWKCEIVDVHQSFLCAHSYKLKCFEYKFIESGSKNWPECKAAVPDYIHPSCNHTFTELTCEMRRQYEANPPKCERQVTRSRECGHKVMVKCFQRSMPLNPCKEAVNGSKPRCGHQISMPCHDYERLRQNYGENRHCELVIDTQRDQVMIDQAESDYGPEEKTLVGFGHLPGCTVPTLIRRSCSHMTEMPCALAFSAVSKKTIPLCNDLVEVFCIFCHAALYIPCCKKDEYERLYNMLGFRGMLSENTLRSLKEQLQPILVLQLSLKCKSIVKIARTCAHELELPCVELVEFVLGKRMLPSCKEKITWERECGHAIDRKCYQRNKALSDKCRVIVDALFAFPYCGHKLQVKECHDLQQLRIDPEPKCMAIVSTNHIRCDHDAEVCCNIMPLCRVIDDSGSALCLPDTDNIVNVMQRYCQPLPDIPLCRSNVDVKLRCSHIRRNVPCHEAFSWTIGARGEEPQCTEEVYWTSPLCCHELPVPCHDIDTLEGWDPWGGVEIAKEKITLTENTNQFVYRLPLVTNPEVPAAVSNVLPNCAMAVGIMFQDCEHMAVKQCSDLFFAKSPVLCQEQVPVECQNPVCKQVRIIPCGKMKHMSADEIARNCPFKISKTCSLCGANKVSVPCGQILVECNQMVNVTLPCGHQAKWRCAEGVTHPSNYHDGESGLNRKCNECALKVWERWRVVEINEEQVREVAKRKLQSIVKDSTIVREDAIDITMEQYEKARVTSIGKLQNQLHADSTKYAEEKDIPWPNVESPDDILGFVSNHYELVFLPIFKADVSHGVIKEKRLAKAITSFGSGVQIKTLTQQTFEALFEGSEEATKRLCVCLAFTCNRLVGVNPFIPMNLANQLRNLGQSNWSKDQKQYMHQVSNQVITYKGKGFDCVQVLIDGASTDMTVYWHPHSIVPLSVQVFEIRNSCLVCLDHMPKTSKLGAVCRQGHFVCWDSCFLDYVKEARSADSLASYVNDQGYLCCPHCKEGYDIMKVASQSPGDIGVQLFELKGQSQSDKEVRKALKEMERRIEEEKKKIDAMNERERELFILCKQICEEILTNHCPHCGRAFVDFDACFALTCSGQGGCGCQFCAWCFATNGVGDMHGHVVRCPLGNGEVYGDPSELGRVWNEVRRLKINTLLQDRGPEIRSEILKRLAKDFAGIGLVM